MANLPRAVSVQAVAAAACERANVPGIGFAALMRDRVVVAAGHGWADVEERVVAKATTAFLTASCSKLVVTAVVLALCDRRMLDLDGDVAAHLPFALRHPEFPDVAITFRQLLAHRASILDDLDAMRRAYVSGDAAMSLVDWIRGRLGVSEAGSATCGFGAAPPGCEEQYSNTGIAIAAGAAERAARMSFEDLARALVFRPLGMFGTTYRIPDSPHVELATPYDGAVGEPLRRVRQYGYPDYPTGTLRTSAAELALFLQCLLAGGTLRGARILSPASVQAMLPTGAAPAGLGTRRVERQGRAMVGQDGVDLGAGSRVLLDPVRGTGILVLGNAGWTAPPERAQAMVPLEEALQRLADQAAE